MSEFDEIPQSGGIKDRARIPFDREFTRTEKGPHLPKAGRYGAPAKWQKNDQELVKGQFGDYGLQS